MISLKSVFTETPLKIKFYIGVVKKCSNSYPIYVWPFFKAILKSLVAILYTMDFNSIWLHTVK